MVLLDRTEQVAARLEAPCMLQAGETRVVWLWGKVMVIMDVAVGKRGV